MKGVEALRGCRAEIGENQRGAYRIHTVDNVLEYGTWASVQCPPIPPVPPPPTGIRLAHELVGDKPVAVGLGGAPESGT